MTVATLGLGQFVLLDHQQWRKRSGLHALQTKMHCLQNLQLSVARAHRTQPLGIAKCANSSPGTLSSYSPTTGTPQTFFIGSSRRSTPDFTWPPQRHRQSQPTKLQHRRPSQPRRGTTRLGEFRHRDRHSSNRPSEGRPPMPPPKAMPVTQLPQTRRPTATLRASCMPS